MQTKVIVIGFNSLALYADSRNSIRDCPRIMRWLNSEEMRNRLRPT